MPDSSRRLVEKVKGESGFSLITIAGVEVFPLLLLPTVYTAHDENTMTISILHALKEMQCQ